MIATDAEPRGAAKPPCVGSPHTRRGLHQGRRRGPGAQDSSHPGLAAQHRGFWTLTGQWKLSTRVGWPEGPLSLSRLRVCRVWDVTAPQWPSSPSDCTPMLPHRDDPPMTPQASPAAVREGSSIQALAQQLPSGQAGCGSLGAVWDLGIYALIFTFASSPWISSCSPWGCGVVSCI